MIPNITRGDRMAGLMAYLVGPGRANEHENPHLVAGDDRVLMAVEHEGELSSYDAFEIASVLSQPQRVHGTKVESPVSVWDEDLGQNVRVGSTRAEVWHCSLSLAAEEGKIDDAKWSMIANEFVNRMGFIDPDGAKSSRWAAVHHGASKNGNDHIHIVVQMVREDGTKANVHNDFYRSQQVCRELEKEFGLQLLESQEKGLGLAGDKPAERARSTREAAPQSAPFELRRRMRAALATSSTEAQYIQRLLDMGVRVAPSFEKGSRTQVRGYKVAIAGGKNEDGHTIWYTPSKLDRTLGWPQIQQRFGGRGHDEAVTALVGLHNVKDVPAPTMKLHGFDPIRAERLMSGKTGPDTLANIYARVSMQLEKDRPGAFARLSENYARAAQGRGNAAYAVRIGARFASKDSTRGWLAVIQQANRLGRAMTATQLMTERPRLARSTAALLEHANRTLETATTSTTTDRPFDYRLGRYRDTGRGHGL